MSKSKDPMQALNRAYTELGLIRNQMKTQPFTKLHYNRLKDCYEVLGKIRNDYLNKLDVAGN